MAVINIDFCLFLKFLKLIILKKKPSLTKFLIIIYQFY